MALIILRNNFKKFNRDLLLQFPRRRIGALANIKTSPSDKILLQKQVFHLCHILKRPGTTTITIKEYKTSRKYTGYWKFERLLGWSLLFMIPTAFALESKELEMALGTVALTHTYLGCQSMCSDYVRSTVVGKALPIFVRLSVIIMTLSSLAGIYQLVYKDIGIINMIKKFWAIRGKDNVPSKHFTKD